MNRRSVRPATLGGRRARAGIVALAIAVPLLAACNDEVTVQSPASSAGSSPSSSPSSSAGGGPSSSGSSSADPAIVIPGWQVNTGHGPSKNASFQVPPASTTFVNSEGKTEPEWSVGSPDRITGYMNEDNKKEIAAVRGPAVYRDEYCKDKSVHGGLATYGWMRASTSPAEAAPGFVRQWARVVSHVDGPTYHRYGEPKTTQITLKDGKTQAVRSTVDVPNGDKDEVACGQKTLRVTAIVFDDNAGNTATVVGVRALNAPNGVDDATEEKIFSTIAVAP